MNRRQFLSAAAVSAAGILFSDEAFALADNSGFWRRDRLLEMRRADTGERRSIRFYAADRGYLKDGYLVSARCQRRQCSRQYRRGITQPAVRFAGMGADCR